MEFPEKGLVRLIYVSRAEIPDKGRQDAVRDIVIKSMSNNRRVDVTGVLLSNARLFLQVLEGPSASVRAVYETVLKDPRHSDVRLIDLRPGEGRLFRDWNMTSRALSQDIVDPDGLTAEAALDLLKA